jgi:hypothetical protein
MKKIDAHLKELKKIAVEEYKKILQQDVDSVLAPLSAELEHLEKELQRKKRSLEIQKTQIKNAKSAYLSRQEQEIKAFLIIENIWREVIKSFLKQHSHLYVLSAVKNLPNEKGVILFNPEGIMKQELATVKRQRSDLTYKEDRDISEGFIYSNEKLEIDCTIASFSETKLKEFKSQLFSQLKSLKVV